MDSITDDIEVTNGLRQGMHLGTDTFHLVFSVLWWRDGEIDVLKQESK